MTTHFFMQSSHISNVKIHTKPYFITIYYMLGNKNGQKYEILDEPFSSKTLKRKIIHFNRWILT